MNEEIRERLDRIKTWMVENDYECGPEGSEIYKEIQKLLKPEEEEENEDMEECEQCGEPAWDGYICHACGLKHI